MKQQFQEAISAGMRALDTLHRAQEKMNSAKNWGLFDLLGGDFLATMIKRGKMSEAQDLIEDLRRDLRAFQREIRDVEIITKVDLDDSGLLTFADYFFDDFLSDFLVQRKIKKAQDQLKSIERQVQSIVDALTAKYRTL